MMPPDTAVTTQGPPPPTTPQQFAKRQLRVMLLCTVLLTVPQLGRIWHHTVIFEFIGLFSVPTGIIPTVAIAWTVRRRWRENRVLLALAALNVLLFIAAVPLMLR